MPTFELTFESGEKSLGTRIFSVQEGISKLFQLSVIALSEKADIDLESLVGKAVEFRALSAVAHLTQRARHWKGVVSYIEQLRTETSEKGQSTYSIIIVPKLWLLTQRQNYRIFQHLSVPDITDKILGEWGIEPAWAIDRGAYPKLEYKVQYGESDYGFLSRLLEEAGIAFLFPDGAGGSLLTFSDHLSTGKLHDASPVQFVDEPNQSSEKEFVTDVQLCHGVRPGAYTVRDHDFRKPSFELLGVAPKAPAPEARYEQYHYRPGAFLVEGAKGGGTPVADDKGIARHEQPAGTAYATRSLAAERAGKREISFASNVFGLQPGALLTIDHHPHPALAPASWLLLTELQIEGGHGVQWTTSIKAAFALDGYRPPHATPKPEVKGVQSATVVGPPGEEIYVDELGRARVQFPWDREGKRDDDSSCWMRVSQGWAGTGFGALSLPRVGQEVLVGFLGGDPDQPIIVGRVFNATEQVPYKLPQHKSRSTWKSNSYPGGGGGFNEILFEDAREHELVYMQAQKNLRQLVKNDETVTVGGDRQDLVKGDLSHEIRGNHKVLVGAGQDLVVRSAKKELVGADSDLHVKGGRVVRVDGDDALIVGGEVHVKAGSAIVLEGPDLTLQGPGGFIRIDATGVTIVGLVVNINSGGTPGVATGRATVADATEAKPEDVSATGIGQ